MKGEQQAAISHLKSGLYLRNIRIKDFIIYKE